VLLIIQSAFSQIQNLGDWMVTVNTGIEAHDKRIFDYLLPFLSAREILLAKSPEFWGTYHLGLSDKRKVCQKKRFCSFLGSGISYENATFNRPFDHTLLVSGPTTSDIKGLNRYKKIFAPLALSSFYGLGNHWFISVELVSNLLVFRSIENTGWSRESSPLTEGGFELDDMQLRLGLNGRIGKVIIGIHSKGCQSSEN